MYIECSTEKDYDGKVCKLPLREYYVHNGDRNILIWVCLDVSNSTTHCIKEDYIDEETVRCRWIDDATARWATCIDWRMQSEMEAMKTRRKWKNPRGCILEVSEYVGKGTKRIKFCRNDHGNVSDESTKTMIKINTISYLAIVASSITLDHTQTKRLYGKCGSDVPFESYALAVVYVYVT